MNRMIRPAMPKFIVKFDAYLDKTFTSTLFGHREIFSMLFPLILDQLFIFLISMLTASMISASSQLSVAAVSLVNPMSFLIMSMFTAVSAGGTVVVAQYKGRGDEESMKSAAGQVIFSTIAVASILTLVIVIVADPLIRIVYGGGSTPTDPVVLDKAIDYLVGMSLSTPTFAVYNGVFAVLRGVGDTKICLRLTVIINAIHLVASMLFLNVLKLDILGTALSYNVARIIGGAIAIALILSQRTSIKLKARDIFKFNWKMQKSIVKMGIPFVMEQVFLNGGMVLSQIYMVSLGTVAIAANSITSSMLNLFYSGGCGVMALAITVVGQCVGSGNIELARSYGKKLLRLSNVVMLITIAIIYPLVPLILKLFAPEAETVGVIYQLMFIGIIPLPFLWSLSNVMPSVLRAAGDATYPSVASLIAMWVFRVGLGYLLAIPLGFGVHGVVIAMVVEWAVRGILFWIRFKGDKWLSKRVV